MYKKLLTLVMAVCFSLGLGVQAQASEKMILYTSMKESLIGALYDAFKKEHPDVTIDYQSAGAGKLMAKIAAERQSGKVLAEHRHCRKYIHFDLDSENSPVHGMRMV